jgi:hypothetical protein
MNGKRARELRRLVRRVVDLLPTKKEGMDARILRDMRAVYLAWPRPKRRALLDRWTADLDSAAKGKVQA